MTNFLDKTQNYTLLKFLLKRYIKEILKKLDSRLQPRGRQPIFRASSQTSFCTDNELVVFWGIYKIEIIHEL